MIAIVTETLSCLNDADCAAFGVSLAPLDCVDGDRVLRDRILSTAEPLSGSDVFSVPPSEEAYLARFETLLETFDCVLCITASHKFSDSYRNAIRAALPLDGRVVVIDSGSVAGGIFLVVLRARYLIASGYPMSRIKAELESYKNTLRVSFTADSALALQSAKKLSYKMPDICPIPSQKPVFHIKRGGIGVTTYVSGERRVMDELLVVLERGGIRKSPAHIVIHYADRTPAIEYLRERIAALHPAATVYERPITLSLQVNLGQDIVGLIGD